MHTDVQGRWVTCLIVQAEHAHRLSEVRGALESARIRHGGEVFQDPALLDRLCSTFPRPEAAVAAVHTLRDSLFGEAESAALPAQLRIAIAAGPFEVNDPWAPGSALERANGLLALAHGGQTLLTAETADLVGHALPAGTSLAALGTHRLRDLHNSIQVVQLRQPDGPVAFPPLRSLDVVPNNLPAQVTSFVGRRQAVSEVQEHLQTSRLVTLTGPGGSGKTRLALQVGAALLEQFPDGVWMVDLSNLTDPNLVPLAVAAALHVPDAPGRPPGESLCAALAAKRLLILLDNCEHLVLACARLARSLLAGCPLVRILATSREPLGIDGETAWPTPPLSVPSGQGSIAVDGLLQYEAIRLFVERAKAASPSFAVTEQNAGALANLCQRLDGIPLAIELAAARSRILSVEQIAERLDDRLRLLTAGRRHALQRHQTLGAAIDWSYELLSPAERLLWQRLAIFGGNFSLSAVESICAGGEIDSIDVLDLLAQLVDKSLVVAEEQNGEKRYRLLETIRQYGRNRLQESGEEEELRRAHCEWCLTQVEPIEALRGNAAHQMRLKLDQDNLRQAVLWTLETREYDLAIRLCGGLWYYWFIWGDINEHWGQMVQLAEVEPGPGCLEAKGEILLGLSVFAFGRGEADLADRYGQRALAFGREHRRPQLVSTALHNLSMVLRALGRFDTASQHLQEALVISRAGGDKLREAWFLTSLGAIASDVGDVTTARRYAEEGLVIQRQIGHQGGVALAMEILGQAAIDSGDLDTARSHLELALQIRRSVSNKEFGADALLALSQLAFARGEYQESHQLHLETLRAFWEMGKMAGVAYALEGVAWLAAAAEDGESALRLAGGSELLLRQSGYVSPPRRARITDIWLARARAGRDPVKVAEAIKAGGELTVKGLMDLAADVGRSLSAPAPAKQLDPTPQPALDLRVLSPREWEIVKMVAQGLTAREIGQRLFLSPRTVEKHEENIRMKLEIPNRAALIAWAHRKGALEGI